LRCRADIGSSLRDVNGLIFEAISASGLTIVELDASRALAATTASPIFAATLLPDRNGTDSSSEDGCGGDELLHGRELATVVGMLESIALPARTRASPHGLLISRSGIWIYSKDSCLRCQDRRTQEAPCTDRPWHHRVYRIVMSSTVFI